MIKQRLFSYIGICLLSIVFLAGCTKKPEEVKGNETMFQNGSHNFILSVETDRLEYDNGEGVCLTASLTYLGPDNQVDIFTAIPEILFTIFDDTGSYRYGWETKDLQVRTTLTKNEEAVFSFGSELMLNEELRERIKTASGFDLLRQNDGRICLVCPAGSYQATALLRFFLNEDEPAIQEAKARTSFQVD